MYCYGPGGMAQGERPYTSDNIVPVYLPSYSPELNPIERLWQWLRKEVTHNTLFKTLEALMDALEKEFR